MSEIAKTTLFVSGGLVSTVEYHYTSQKISRENVEALFIYYDQPASAFEYDSLNRLSIPATVIGAIGFFIEIFINRRKYIRTAAPFVLNDLTRSEIVRLGDKLGLSKTYLLRTTSCISSLAKNCGTCNKCFDRWISWVNNDIPERFQVHPFSSEYAKSTIEKMCIAPTSKRKIEVHNALVRFGEKGLFSTNATIETNDEDINKVLLHL